MGELNIINCETQANIQIAPGMRPIIQNKESERKELTIKNGAIFIMIIPPQDYQTKF